MGKEKAKDEIVLTSANELSVVHHNAASIRVHTCKLSKSDEEPLLRTAKEWLPVIQSKKLGKVEHQQQNFVLRRNCPWGVSKSVTNGRLNLQVHDLGARMAGQMFPCAPRAPQDFRSNMRLTSTLGAWQPCKTR